MSNSEISERVMKHFDFRLAGILKHFDLRGLPIKYPMGFYQKLAASGHFGRDDLELPWEKLDKVDFMVQG
jgi:S-adenosylmethionine synthetase